VSMLSEGELDWLNAYHARVASEVRPHLDDTTKTWLDQATVALS
jgi:Xaa-Pro aminopeptidase